MTKPVISDEEKDWLEKQGVDVSKIKSNKDLAAARDTSNTGMFRRIATGE